MEVKAHLRHLRIAPRKVRLVINLVRGMSVEKALDQLSVLPKRSSLPVTKLIQSAVANAKHNFNLDEKTLVVKSIIANEGPKLKRWMPKAFGRANPILKRTTHITVILEGKELAKKPTEPKEKKPVKADIAEVKEAPATAKTRTVKKTAVKKSPTPKVTARDAQDAEVARKGEE